MIVPRFGGWHHYTTDRLVYTRIFWRHYPLPLCRVQLRWTARVCEIMANLAVKQERTRIYREMMRLAKEHRRMLDNGPSYVAEQFVAMTVLEHTREASAIERLAETLFRVEDLD